MARNVSAVTDANLIKPATEPFFLVCIDYPSTLRKSSRGTVTWDGYTWLADDLIVTVSPDRNEGTLKIQNSDNIFGGIVLTDCIADIPIQIYQVHGDSLAIADVELLFDGVGSGADPDTRWVVVDLEKGSTGKMQSPRVRCCEATGFMHLPPAGLSVSYGGETYILEVQ